MVQESTGHTVESRIGIQAVHCDGGHDAGERDRIHYDDPITNFLPELKDLDPRVTIRHLLTHTSGIPDVGDLGIDHPNLKESEMISAISQQHAYFAELGEKYRYSNTGYSLLGMIIERVSGMPLDDLLARNIFQPLGMKNTRLACRPGYTKGDGGIVSTVDDLLKWDQALYYRTFGKTDHAERGVHTGTRAARNLDLARVSPFSRASRIWLRMEYRRKGRGPVCLAHRRLRERILVVILTDRGPSPRLEICDAIVNILHNKP